MFLEMFYMAYIRQLNSSPPGQNGLQFGRRHFQSHFCNWKYKNFDQDFTEICSHVGKHCVNTRRFPDINRISRRTKIPLNTYWAVISEISCANTQTQTAHSRIIDNLGGVSMSMFIDRFEQTYAGRCRIYSNTIIHTLTYCAANSTCHNSE